MSARPDRTVHGDGGVYLTPCARCKGSRKGVNYCIAKGHTPLSEDKMEAEGAAGYEVEDDDEGEDAAEDQQEEKTTQKMREPKFQKLHASEVASTLAPAKPKLYAVELGGRRKLFRSGCRISVNFTESDDEEDAECHVGTVVEVHPDVGTFDFEITGDKPYYYQCGIPFDSDTDIVSDDAVDPGAAVHDTVIDVCLSPKEDASGGGWACGGDVDGGGDYDAEADSRFVGLSWQSGCAKPGSRRGAPVPGGQGGCWTEIHNEQLASALARQTHFSPQELAEFEVKFKWADFIAVNVGGGKRYFWPVDNARHDSDTLNTMIQKAGTVVPEDAYVKGLDPRKSRGAGVDYKPTGRTNLSNLGRQLVWQEVANQVGDAKGNATVYREVADKYGSTALVISHVRIYITLAYG